MKSVSLALQGGASLGAYTWGVLDALLEDGRLHFEGVTGASAGAINAVALADGLAAGGNEGARATLRTFWERLARAADERRRSRLGRAAGALRALAGTSSAERMYDLVLRLVADFEIEPTRMEPLRSVLLSVIDFERVRRKAPLKVFVNATNARTYAIRVFGTDELTPDAICASSCIPFLFPAVEVGGELYWDGGFLGNPAIFPVLYECSACDVVLVETLRLGRPRPPASAAEILARVVEVASVAALVRELRAIEFVSDLAHRCPAALPPGVREVHVHRIAPHPALGQMEDVSSLRADLPYFRRLHALGYEAGEHWLERDFGAIADPLSR